MKTIIRNFMMIALLAFVATACDNDLDINYKVPVNIGFKNVDDKNIVNVDKGVYSYKAEINIISHVELDFLELRYVNAKTGEAGNTIDGSYVELEGAKAYNFEYEVNDLVENKAIQVVVTDVTGKTFQRNLLIQITPSVIFTDEVFIETVDCYYGMFFAGWHNGRVYMRRNGPEFASEIDFSLGNFLTEGASGDVVATPKFVSPEKRKDNGLMTIAGLQGTLFELTDMTVADYKAITRVDDSAIVELTDPTLEVVELENGKVYLFKTVKGKKGLIHVSKVEGKTNTIEVSQDDWVGNTPYHLVTLTTKIVAW